MRCNPGMVGCRWPFGPQSPKPKAQDFCTPGSNLAGDVPVLQEPMGQVQVAMPTQLNWYRGNSIVHGASQRTAVQRVRPWSVLWGRAGGFWLLGWCFVGVRGGGGMAVQPHS